MKCLSILQPYAHLIITGEKRVENRRWASSHRGPLLIHAAKSDARLDEWRQYHPDQVAPDDMAFGAIVGGCRVAEIFHVTHKHIVANRKGFDWLRRHVHCEGPWCFVLEAVHRLATPIPYRGQQGLFDVPNQVVQGARWIEVPPLEGKA